MPQSNPVSPRLKDFKEGDVFLVETPKRIVKIIGRDVVEITNSMSGEVREYQALRTISTLPIKPIEGFVTPDEAKSAATVGPSLERTQPPPPTPKWHETWIEQAIVRTRTVGRYKIIDESATPRPIKVICYDDDRPRKRHHALTGKIITGWFIPAELVPPGLFENENESPAEEPQAAQQAEAKADGNDQEKEARQKIIERLGGIAV